MSTIARDIGTASARRTRSLSRSRVRIGPGSAGLLMTAEQFDAPRPSQFVRGNRYELINGVVVVSPVPGIDQRRPNDDLGTRLDNYHDTPAQGSAMDETAPEPTIATKTRRRSDRAIWTGLGRVPTPDTDIPSIVAEFGSKRRRDVLRDYEIERDESFDAGVQEDWVIDRFRRILTVYRRDAAGLSDDIVPEGGTYRTERLPGFELPLAQLLAKADQWTRTKDRPKQPRKPTPPAGGTDG